MAGVQHHHERQAGEAEALSGAAGTVRAVLFDLDDTLFDHRESSAAALRGVQRAHACFSAAPFEEIQRQHSILLEALHPDVVAGRIGLDEARRERFRRLFDRFGLADPGIDLCDAVARTYRSDYQRARRATAGAAALLEAIPAHVRVVIVSNNIRQEQQEKLEYCGLASRVDALVVSEEAGVAKPDPQIFRIALEAAGAGAPEAVMLGDSWAADIAGARAAGIRAVWFNPLRLPSPEPAAKVREIYSLEPAEDVLRVLLNVEKGRNRRSGEGEKTF